MRKIVFIFSFFFVHAISAQLVINEVLYDPPAGSIGDANGDGVRDAIEDEFIEFVNNSASDLDVSGYKIYDVNVSDNTRTLRHTIPENTVMPPYGILVIFGGGTPTGYFGGATVITDIGSAGLSLGNSGERIEVDNVSDVTILTFDSDALSNNPDESYTRFPDITGSFVQHEQDASTDGITTALFSPGTMVTISTWTGNGDTDTDWDTTANWSNGVPTFLTTAIIPNLDNDPIASSGLTVFNMVLEESTSLTSNGNVTSTGVISAYSGASFITASTVTGNLKYHRNLPNSNWYLVSTPVKGETIEDMIINNDFDTGSDSNIGFAPYDNTQATTAERWDYQTTSSTGSIDSGQGYSVKLTSAGTLLFTGVMSTTDESIAMTDGSGSGGNTFNLIGNPYPSFLAANTNADNTNNLLTLNSMNLTEETLWFWDQSTGAYDEINLASQAFYVAPAQGFFVSSNGNNMFNFKEAMQSHQTSDSFQRASSNRPEIALFLTDGSDVRNAEIYYLDGATTGFDNGYDSSIFDGVENTFAIYTQSIANGTGRNLGIQSLPDSDLENMIIPIGIIADTGTEITISAESMNLPEGINTYLEDRILDQFTLLDNTSDFTITWDSDLNGVGRFYIHTTSESLNSNEFNLERIRFYLAETNTLRILGIQNEEAQIRIYNVLGNEVFKNSFQGNGSNNITLPNLQLGLYIIQLQTLQGKLSKKIIIK